MIRYEHMGASSAGRAAIRTRPTVHRLYRGAWLREDTRLSDDLIAVPLQPIGSDDPVDFLADYAELIGARFDKAGVLGARLKGIVASPVIALVLSPRGSDGQGDLLAHSRQALALGGTVLSSMAGQKLLRLADLVHEGNGDAYYSLAPDGATPSRILSILGSETPELHQKVFAQAQESEEYRFALVLFRDAVTEPNPRFRLARLFNVLEGLASENKAEGLGSRKAVRTLLGMCESGEVREFDIEGRKYQIDLVELAGRFRDKLFHGVPFKQHHLTDETKHGYEALEIAPTYLGDNLAEYCRVALYSEVVDELDVAPSVTTLAELDRCWSPTE